MAICAVNLSSTAITPFRFIKGHRFRYQSKAHIRLLFVINTNLSLILHR